MQIRKVTTQKRKHDTLTYPRKTTFPQDRIEVAKAAELISGVMSTKLKMHNGHAVACCLSNKKAL
jgi:hypothetical protein